MANKHFFMHFLLIPFSAVSESPMPPPSPAWPVPETDDSELDFFGCSIQSESSEDNWTPSGVVQKKSKSDFQW